MPRATGEETRSAIKAAALEVFSTRGADVPLDDIARAVGITRAAVLHHFGSKAALWEEVVAEFTLALEDILGGYDESAPPLTGKARKQLLARVVETYCDHRKVVLLILRNVSGNWPQVELQITRLAGLLVGTNPSNMERVIADSVLGVIVRPLIDPFVKVDAAEVRSLLAATAAQVASRLDKARAATG